MRNKKSFMLLTWLLFAASCVLSGCSTMNTTGAVIAPVEAAADDDSPYVFTGWNTDPHGKGTSYQPGDTIPAGYVTSDIDLYAQWKPKEYKISYDLDGGSASGNPGTYNIESRNITLNSPTRSGYTFLGWTGSSDLSSGLDMYTEANPYVANERDMYFGNDFPVEPGKTYRTIITAKRTKGTIDFEGGIFYTQYTSGYSWDAAYQGNFKKAEDLSNGYSVYYIDISVPEGKQRAQIYLELQQWAGNYTTSWNVYDMHVICMDDNNVIPTGSTGNKEYTARWMKN